MDEEAKKAFLQMPIEEQLLAIIDGQSFIRARLASLEKRQIEFEEDVKLYRRMRELVDDNNKTQRIVDGVVKALKGNNDLTE